MNPSPPPEFASYEGLVTVKHEVNEIKDKQKEMQDKLHDLDIKASNNHLILDRVETKVDQNAAKLDRWGWTLIGFLITMAGGFVWFVLNNMPQGGG